MSDLLKAYLTASGSYPERETSSELTPTLIDNANKLLSEIKALFEELDLNIEDYSISSGFRPSDANKKTPNAAKSSLHQQCLAIDIVDDKSQTLAKIMRKNADKRKKRGIWLECPDYTKGKNTNWVHLDLSISRKLRDSMEFIP